MTLGDGQGCPRPAQGRWRLCQSHSVAWWKRRAKGDSFEEFLARAQPLAELGACTAASCYRAVANPQTGLCVPHGQLWRADGRPAGQAFEKWAARVRRPVNSRVLSLRGLPELVRLELVYAIGCRAAEQVSVVTGGMRPWIDQLRAAAVSSVTEFDLAELDHVGDRHHVRFARFSVDRVRLAYADPEKERANDVWDLRLFGRSGHRHIDFTAIRQPWLREAAKGWAAATVGRVGDGALAHRIGSVAVLSAVLGSGLGGGQDPRALGRSDVERFLTRLRADSFSTGGHAQIIRKLAEGNRLLAGGAELDQVCRHLEVAESTWHRWLAQYGGMKASDAKRLKELEVENTRLKKLLAEAELDKAMLKELAEGNF
jgi:putative transposase